MRTASRWDVCRGLWEALVGSLVSGGLTVRDATLYRLLALLKEAEGISLEPSALAGLPGPYLLESAPEWENYRKRHLPEGALEKGTHVVWATGGSMVPEKSMREYLEKGRSLL